MITYEELVAEYRNWIFENLVDDEMSREDFDFLVKKNPHEYEPRLENGWSDDDVDGYAVTNFHETVHLTEQREIYFDCREFAKPVRDEDGDIIDYETVGYEVLK